MAFPVAQTERVAVWTWWAVWTGRAAWTGLCGGTARRLITFRLDFEGGADKFADGSDMRMRERKD